MANMLSEKVLIGLDNAPSGFDIRNRILGPNGTNLEYIRSETGVVAILKGGQAEKYDPLYISLHHARTEALTAARSLAHNLIETVRAELNQWTAARTAPPPSLNVPPPVVTNQPPPVPPPSNPPPSSITTLTQGTNIAPIVSVAQTTPLMTMRQPTVLQLLPQQQYVLNQENGQLIPIQGIQVSSGGNITTLPIGQTFGTLQQQNFSPQIVDLGNMQSVNVAQLRLGGTPMIFPNGISLPQISSGNIPEVTSVSSTMAPIVSSTSQANAPKIQWTTEKGSDKIQLQGGEMVQWAVPGSQTMLIPYQQLQDLANQGGLHNMQQQIVSIAQANNATWPGGLSQTQLPLGTTQIHQIHPGAGNVFHINSVKGTPLKTGQDIRGQKRLADGSPSGQMQLRPIAPAGSQVDKAGNARDDRPRATWSAGTGRETISVTGNQIVKTSMGTIVQSSTGQQTSATNQSSDKGDKIATLNKDGLKPNEQKILGTGNMQMISLPQGMTVLPNAQIQSSMGQAGGQIYMIPASQANTGLPQNVIPQQIIQAGQPMMQYSAQPNQIPYNMPIMQVMSPNAQYLPMGLNTAQQLNMAIGNPQLLNHNSQMVQSPQANVTMLNPQVIPLSQAVQYMQHQQGQNQNQSFLSQTSQYSNVPQQFVVQSSNQNPTFMPANQGNPTQGVSNIPPQLNQGGGDTANQNPTQSFNETGYPVGYSIRQANMPLQNNQPGSTSNSQTLPQFDASNTANAQNGHQSSASNMSSESVQSSNTGNGNFGNMTLSNTQPPQNQSGDFNDGGSNQATNQGFSGPNSQNGPTQNFSSVPQNIGNFPPGNQNSNGSFQNGPPNRQPYPNNGSNQSQFSGGSTYQGSFQQNRPWFRPRFGGPAGPQYQGQGPPQGPGPLPPPPCPPQLSGPPPLGRIPPGPPHQGPPMGGGPPMSGGPPMGGGPPMAGPPPMAGGPQMSGPPPPGNFNSW